MSKPVHHTLDIYGTELHLAYDRRAWATLRRINDNLDKVPDGIGGMCDSRERDTDRQHTWVWIDLNDVRHDDPHELADTIAHEATHVAMSILRRHAIPADCGNDEPLAYLVGWLTAWIWRNMPERAA